MVLIIIDFEFICFELAANLHHRSRRVRKRFVRRDCTATICCFSRLLIGCDFVFSRFLQFLCFVNLLLQRDDIRKIFGITGTRTCKLGPQIQ